MSELADYIQLHAKTNTTSWAEAVSTIDSSRWVKAKLRVEYDAIGKSIYKIKLMRDLKLDTDIGRNVYGAALALAVYDCDYVLTLPAGSLHVLASTGDTAAILLEAANRALSRSLAAESYLSPLEVIQLIS